MDQDELTTLVEQIDQGELPDDHQVPLSVVRAIRAELNQVRERERTKDDELLLYKTTVRNLQAGAQSAGAGGLSDPENMNPQAQLIDRFFAGREDDDVPTVAEIKQLTTQLITAGNVQAAEAARINQVQSQQDFNEIVYTHFPEYLRSIPQHEAQELASEIASIPSPAARFRMAYRYGKLAPGYLGKRLADNAEKNETTGRARVNAEKPRSTAVAGTAGSVASSDLDRVNAAQPGTPEFRRLQQEFAARGRG